MFNKLKKYQTMLRVEEKPKFIHIVRDGGIFVVEAGKDTKQFSTTYEAREYAQKLQENNPELTVYAN